MWKRCPPSTLTCACGSASIRARSSLVIGENKFAYDLWGDSVNIASRMESHGLAGRIHVSEIFARTAGGAWRFEPRGRIDVKGQRPMQTYFLSQPADS